MKDRVTPAVALAVLQRDGGCVAPRLGGSYADCAGRNRLEHVKDEPRMGRRAPSDPAHLVTLCEGHTEAGMRAGYVWATDKVNRLAMRAYLLRVNGADCGVADMAEVDWILERMRPDMEAHPEEYTLEALQRRIPLPEEDVARLRREHPEWPW